MKMKLISIVFLILFGLLLPLQSMGQAQDLVDFRLNPARDSRLVSHNFAFDTDSVRDWMIEADKLSIEDSVKSWEMLVVSINATYKPMAVFMSPYNRTPDSPKIFLAKSSKNAMKAWLRYLHESLETVHSISLGLVDFMFDFHKARQSSYGLIFMCAEFDNGVDKNNPDSVRTLIDSTLRPCLAKYTSLSGSSEKVNRQVSAVLGVYRTALILGATQFENQIELLDPEMREDFFAVRGLMEKIFDFSHDTSEVSQHLVPWLTCSAKGPWGPRCP
jgi:hypothetical protein